MASVAIWTETACRWEATARKPGNVCPGRSFDDLTYPDFLRSASAIAPVMDDAVARGVGATVLRAIQATRQVVASNTNLGIVLLLAPLAAVRPEVELRRGVDAVLASLGIGDAHLVYEAIRLALPGGLGRVKNQDVSAAPTVPLREIMALVADRDLVARQYANGYREVFEDGVRALEGGSDLFGCLEGAIIHCHLTLLSRYPDSLIARKRGPAEAKEASRRAGEVVARAGLAGWPAAVADLDDWLRDGAHGRNPGTTADLVTASLFVALRTGILQHSSSLPWTAPSLLSKKKGTSPTPAD